MNIASISDDLYEALKEVYNTIDNNKNEIFKEGEFIYHEIKYTYEIQKNIRKALKNYDDYCKNLFKIDFDSITTRLLTSEENENISKPFVNITPTTCVNFKELILSLLRHQRWTINDVKFSEKGNLESINIKFASEFALGNSPWDPRISGQKVPSQNETI